MNKKQICVQDESNERFKPASAVCSGSGSNKITRALEVVFEVGDLLVSVKNELTLRLRK